MEGLDSMIARILEEAREQAREQIRQGQAQAEEITRSFQQQEREQAAAIRQSSQREAAQLLEKARLAAERERRSVLLQVRQAEILDSLRRVYHGLCQMASEPYFKFLHNLLGQVLRPGQAGEIWFGAYDLQRMPAGFPHQIKKLAAQKKGKLTISQQPAEIEGGFLLVYGGVTENCSLQMLMESCRDDQKQRLAFLLFEGAGI